jgi:steroid delta-isomerase-like uncharacterized protein
VVYDRRALTATEASVREKSIKLIRSYYEAFNAGNMRTFLSYLTEDVIHDINQGAVEVGKDAFARFMDRMRIHYDEQVEDLVVMATDDGRHASAEFKIHGTYLKTDAGLPEARQQKYVLPVGAFFAVRDGLIARVTNYYNLQAWLRLVR